MGVANVSEIDANWRRAMANPIEPTIVIPFTTRTDAGGTWFEGSVPISRLAYKVGDGEWADVSTVADTVQIRFKLLVPRQ